MYFRTLCNVHSILHSPIYRKDRLIVKSDLSGDDCIVSVFIKRKLTILYIYNVCYILLYH